MYFVKCSPQLSWNRISKNHIQIQRNKNNFVMTFNPFAPGDFAEKRVLKLVEWFSGHCRAIKS